MSDLKTFRFVVALLYALMAFLFARTSILVGCIAALCALVWMVMCFTSKLPPSDR
jgi:hypothetical protein